MTGCWWRWDARRIATISAWKTRKFNATRKARLVARSHFRKAQTEGQIVGGQLSTLHILPPSSLFYHLLPVLVNCRELTPLTLVGM